jgi:hypothetical protein
MLTCCYLSFPALKCFKITLLQVCVCFLSIVTPFFESGRRNNVANYRGIAVLSAIPKLFKLLVYRGMYEELKNLISEEEFDKGRSTVLNLVDYSFFVLNAVEDGCHVDSVYTCSPNSFDGVQHCLMSEQHWSFSLLMVGIVLFWKTLKNIYFLFVTH